MHHAVKSHANPPGSTPFLKGGGVENKTVSVMTGCWQYIVMAFHDTKLVDKTTVLLHPCPGHTAPTVLGVRGS